MKNNYVNDRRRDLYGCLTKQQVLFTTDLAYLQLDTTSAQRSKDKIKRVNSSNSIL